MYLLLLAIATIFSFLIYVPGYFPYLGVSLTLATLATLVFYFKKEKTLLDTVFFFFTIAFSFFIVYRANEFLIFLDILAVFTFGSLMVLSHKEEKHLSFFQFFTAPIRVFFESLKSKNIFVFNFDLRLRRYTNIKQEYVHQLAVSLTISILLLLVVIPLLASANPLFGKTIGDVFAFFNIETLLKNIFTADYLIIFIRLCIFFIFAIFLPRLLTYINLPKNYEQKLTGFFQSLPLLLPKLVIASILVLFFITQAQLYFATTETLQSLGLTHSQYAREVFAQLSIVSFIILGLVYNDKSKRSESKILTYFLLIEGVFLTCIALKSVYDYSTNWGFTHKRLWGYTGVFWMFGTLGIFFYSYLRDMKQEFFVKAVLLLSGLTLIAVNIANFDYLIFHFRKSTTHSGVDYLYLARLSSDAKSYNEHLQILLDTYKADTKNKYSEVILPATNVVLYKINVLQEKYQNVDFRTFNFSEFKQYQSIKTLNTKEYHNVFTPLFLLQQ